MEEGDRTISYKNDAVLELQEAIFAILKVPLLIYYVSKDQWGGK